MPNPKEQDTENQLVGRCPICQAAAASTVHSSAYVGCTINDSDKDVYLVWSEYYQQNVCRVCNEEGKILTVDAVRDNDDRKKESERQKMGFVKTYTKNTVLG